MKPLLYVAGPYTNPDPVENMHKAIVFADRLLDSGLVTPIVPHLSGTWHMVKPRPYQDWLDYDLEIMRRCDAVFRLPGSSSGADAEVAEAVNLDIPVFDRLWGSDVGEGLYPWAENWTKDHAGSPARP